MMSEELRDLAALHALGLLEGEERERFEKELARNSEVKEALETYLATCDWLALTVEHRQPPQELEDCIFESLGPQRATGKVASGPSGQDDRGKRGEAPADSTRNAVLRFWMPWGVAAALALLSAALWLDRLDKIATISAQDQELESKERRLSRQAVELASRDEAIAQQRAEIARQLEIISERDERILALEQESVLDNLRIAVLKSQLESAPDAQAVAVWDSGRQRGRLNVSNLPAVPPGKEYQLWLIDVDLGAPVSAGVFNTDDAGEREYAFAGSLTVSKVDAFALSVEDEGGRPAPEGPIVLAGE